ncbi:MAG: 4Fe-4S binding protein [Proteobacteria bacterium]|nr:4Fe-4S binding protein [Pseudomonadota bacterium]
MKENPKIPRGGDAVGGSAHDYETGGWRKLTPVLDREKCIDCLICWISCPDTAIILEDGKMVGFNMDHCKGCGICDDVCPDKVKAIKMEEEHS